MSGAVELLVRIASLASLVAVSLTTWWAWRARDRWGRVPRPAAMLGAGPYRRAPAQSWVPRGTPPRVAVVAGMGVAWGLVTMTVLAPSGLLFLLAPARHDPARQLLLMLSGLGVFGTSVAGLVLGPALVRASRALLERRPEAEQRALEAASWSTMHHAMVLLAFVLFAVHERDPSFAMMVSVPCSIGLVHAWSLAHVARYAARLRDPESEPATEGDTEPCSEDRAPL